jgi:hypothetical protein
MSMGLRWQPTAGDRRRRRLRRNRNGVLVAYDPGARRARWLLAVTVIGIVAALVVRGQRLAVKDEIAAVLPQASGAASPATTAQ